MDIAHWANTPEDKQTKTLLVIMDMHMEGALNELGTVKLNPNMHTEKEDVIEDIESNDVNPPLKPLVFATRNTKITETVNSDPNGQIGEEDIIEDNESDGVNVTIQDNESTRVNSNPKTIGKT